MIAVILAAGRGRRLAPAGWDKPKCLLEFGGKTLLERLIDAVQARGIARIVVVVGYRDDLVRSALQRFPNTCDIVVNNDFDDTNTIHSLWLARDFLGRGFLYFNADVLFDARVLDRLLPEPDTALAVIPKPCTPEDVKVVVDDARRILRIGKDLPPERCLGEFIGMARFTAPTARALCDSLEHFNERLGRRDCFFEAALDAILDAHVVRAVSIAGLPAIEIDTPEDLERARQLAARALI